MPKIWKSRENDTFSCDIFGLHAIPMLKYRSLKKLPGLGQPYTARTKP